MALNRSPKMEERQPEKRNDRNSRHRNRNRNRGNRDGGPRSGGNREGTPNDSQNASAKPEEVMAYVDEIGPETPEASGAATPRVENPRSETGNRQPQQPNQANNRNRDNDRNRDREQDRNRDRDQDRNRGERPERDADRNRGERNDRNRNRDRDQDRNRESDRRETDPDTERGPRNPRPEPVMTGEWNREDELRPSDPRPGESRLGAARIADITPPDNSLDERLVVGITLGDYNGIGPEVILKALRYNQMQRVCTPVIYGSMRVLNRYRNLLNLKDWNLNGIQHIGQASHKMTNVITCWNENARQTPQPATAETPKPVLPAEGPETDSVEGEDIEAQKAAQAETTPQPAPLTHEIQPGKVTPEAGQAAFASLERALEDLKAGKLDALITGPINKHNMQSESFKFPGHTEYLAQAFGVPDDLMFMVSETLRVGVVTGHVPLGRVRQNVTRPAINQKLTMMMQSLKVDFGIEKPRIAVLGLNPHAGENGLLGNDEIETIIPVIEDWRKKGELVYGPFPADGFFGTRNYRKFDAVLAMYHDQGLIPFKAIAFDEGVNFTAGLPAVRTSPDHGTAYDIAGKNLADETSMMQAIYLACDVARRRKEHQKTEENALKK